MNQELRRSACPIPHTPKNRLRRAKGVVPLGGRREAAQGDDYLSTGMLAARQALSPPEREWAFS
jgi:hypothetical protein